MSEGRIELTRKALHRLRAVEAVVEGRLKQGQAGEQLGLTTRQVKRLVVAYRREGARGLVSRREGRASNRRLKEPGPQGSGATGVRSLYLIPSRAR